MLWMRSCNPTTKLHSSGAFCKLLGLGKSGIHPESVRQPCTVTAIALHWEQTGLKEQERKQLTLILGRGNKKQQTNQPSWSTSLLSAAIQMAWLEKGKDLQ